MSFRSLNDVCEPYRSLLARLVDVMKSRFGDRLVSIVLYGSVARCEARRDSDVDLLVVVRDLGRSRFRRQDLFMEIEELLEEEIGKLEAMGYHVDFSPIIKSPEEASRISPLYLDMVYDAVILYDRGNFFQSILERLRRKLEELGAERVRVGKLWYWRLKRDYRFGEVIEIE